MTTHSAYAVVTNVARPAALRAGDATAIWGYCVVRLAIGAVLVAAAALKGYEYATWGVVSGAWIDSPWLSLVLAEGEFLLGALLVLGLWPTFTLRTAVACFAVFSLVALFKGLHGEESCGCFGAVEINPWYVFVFDAVAVAALLALPKVCGRRLSGHRSSLLRGALTLALVACALLLGAEAASPLFEGGSSFVHQVTPIFGSGELVVKCDLPVVNTYAKAVSFSNVQASCGCSKAELRQTDLAPGARTFLHLEVHMGPNGGQRRITCVLEAGAGERQVHRVNVAAYRALQFATGSPHVTFGQVYAAERAEKSLDLFLYGKGPERPPPKVVAVEVDSPDLSAAFHNSDEWALLSDGSGTRRKCTLHLHLRARGAAGRQFAAFKVRYAREGKPGFVRATALWTVDSVYRVTPERIHLGALSSLPKSVRRAVDIERRDGRSLNVLSVDVDSDDVSVASVQRIDSRRARVVFDVHPTRETAVFEEVRVKTDDPLQNYATVTVSAVPRSD